MLDFAQKHKEELETKYMNVWGVKKYWYYNACSYFFEKTLEKDTWGNMQYVSVINGEVTGYLGYGICRETRSVSSLEIINFTDNPLFGLDVMQMIKEIFEKYNYRKIEFSVIVGNPIESQYDRLISRYGGRIIGTYKEHVMLPDGKLCDEKLYEIFREDYLKRRKRSGAK